MFFFARQYSYHGTILTLKQQSGLVVPHSKGPSSLTGYKSPNLNAKAVAVQRPEQAPLVDSLKYLSPGRLETTSDSIKVANGHVPLPSFNSLQGSAVDICFFGQLFLSDPSRVPESIDISTYGNMHLGRSIHS